MSTLLKAHEKWYPEEFTLSYWLREKIHGHENELSKQMMGRILTLIDASINDPEQRKALKDMARTIINDTIYCNVFDWAIECVAEKISDKEKEENDPSSSMPKENPAINFVYSRQAK